MEASKKMDVSVPKKRKPLRAVPSQPSSPEKNDIIGSTDEMSYEEERLNYSREGSVNRSQLTHEQENLIDPDDTDDCTDDDSEPIPEKERSVSPVSLESIHNSLKHSGTTPSERMSTKRRPSLRSNLQSHGRDAEVCTDDMDPRAEKERSATPAIRRKLPPVRKPSLSPNPAPLHMEYKSHQRREATTSGNEYIACGAILAIVLLVITYFKSDGSSNVTNISAKAATACDHFYTLEKRYRSLDESLWDVLKVTVRRATAEVGAREPGTMLFLHYGSTVILDGFINSVTNITAECFGGGKEPITLDGQYFERHDIQADYGVFLAQQKEALMQRGVLVVRNFQDVPARAAQAFHTICDTQEPLVDRAVIYLTLDTLKAASVPKPSKQSATEEAETLLRDLWKDSLEPAILQPLITRLTENVYRIV